MTLSVTCECGAHLEIDEKFIGQKIPCPDCQRPLPTRPTPPASANHQVTSGLALTSLVLALVGAFSLIGSITAVVLGYFAHLQIARQPERLVGRRIAWAGMLLGGFFTLLTLASLYSSEVFGIDSLLREFRWASNLDYKAEGGWFKQDSQHNSLLIQRPSALWAKIRQLPSDVQSDKMILLNVREDAHIVIIPFREIGDDAETNRDKAVQKFRESDLVRMMSRPNERNNSPDNEPKPAPGNNPQEAVLDLRVGGFDRTFLIRVFKHNQGDAFILAGGTRKGRFQRLQEEIRKALDSFKLEL